MRICKFIFFVASFLSLIWSDVAKQSFRHNRLRKLSGTKKSAPETTRLVTSPQSMPFLQGDALRVAKDRALSFAKAYLKKPAAGLGAGLVITGSAVGANAIIDAIDRTTGTPVSVAVPVALNISKPASGDDVSSIEHLLVGLLAGEKSNTFAFEERTMKGTSKPSLRLVEIIGLTVGIITGVAGLVGAIFGVRKLVIKTQRKGSDGDSRVTDVSRDGDIEMSGRFTFA